MGNRTELEEEIAGFDRRLFTYLSLFGLGMIAINAVAILLGLRPLSRVRNALAMVREGTAQTARRPFPGGDRAARQRNQRADREQPPHRRALAHAGRQPRAFAEDAACRADSTRAGRSAAPKGSADLGTGGGDARAGRSLSEARPRGGAARQRGLPHAGDAAARAAGARDGEARPHEAAIADACRRAKSSLPASARIWRRSSAICSTTR